MNEKRLLDGRRFSILFQFSIFNFHLSIKQRRLVVIHFLKDRFHEGLADEATAIRYAIPIAETIQRTELTFVEHNRYSKIARLLLHGGLAVRGYRVRVSG